MARRIGQRLIEERPLVEGIVTAATAGGTVSGSGPRPGAVAPRNRSMSRTVSVNLAESPLGWLFAHGHLSRRHYEAGERLRADWERSALDPRVTMSWGGAPIARGRSGSAAIDISGSQIDARRRFDAATAAAGGGLADILWRIVCAGEGMREAERALGWPARAGKLVLTLALDRIADYYRMP